jgi:hypothetical protein
LLHHPVESEFDLAEEEEGTPGLFAKCVMWCQKNKQSCLMSEAHILSAKLEAGQGLDTPVSRGFSGPSKKRVGQKVQKKKEEEDTPVSAGPSSPSKKMALKRIQEEEDSADDDKGEPMETCPSEKKDEVSDEEDDTGDASSCSSSSLG